MVLEHLQGQWLNHFPRQPVSEPDHSFGEQVFPNIQTEPPLVYLEAIPFRPISCHLGEEANPHLATTSFMAVVKIDQVTPEPPPD